MKNENFSSPLGFILAMAGAAVGLGNIWRFSYITGTNGGAAFILVYLGAIALVGFPILLCEFVLGRSLLSNPFDIFSQIAGKKRTKISFLLGITFLFASLVFLPLKNYLAFTLFLIASFSLLLCGWNFFGFVTTVFSPSVLLSYYSVVGGWILIYFCRYLFGQMGQMTPDKASAIMTPLLMAQGNSAILALIGSWAFVLCTAFVIGLGVQKGIERISKICIPLLFALILVIIVRWIFLPGASLGIRFLFVPDFHSLTGKSILAALGHAFFTLSLSAGIGVTYGSYLKTQTNLKKAAFWIIALDTVGAILSGLAIFPVVFAMGLKPDEGSALIFKILPVALSKLQFSHFWGSLFFLVVVIAAFTSAISMLEVLVCVLMKKFNFSRKKALTIWTTFFFLTSGIITFSAANFAHFPKFGAWLNKVTNSNQESLFNALDSLVSCWSMPLGGLAIVIFVGFVWGKEAKKVLAGEQEPALFENVWMLCVRYLTPVLIFFTFLNGLGIF